MEQISNATYPQSINTVLSFRLSHYMRVIFILLSGFAVASIGAIALAQSTRPTLQLSNPFLEYADIFPGQRLSSADGRAYSCWGAYDYDLASQVSCRFTPSSRVFGSVEVSLSEGIVRQITFIVHEDTFNVGKLVLLFGNSNFRSYPRKTFFFWNNLFVIVSTTMTGNHPSVRPVWSVTFTDTY